MSAKRDRLFLLWIFLGHLLFWVCAILLKNICLKDSFEYLFQARNLSSGFSWYCGDGQQPWQPLLESRRPPLYGSFILLCQTLISSPYFLLLIQCLLGTAVIFFVIRLQQRIVPHAVHYAPVMLLLLFFPSQFIYTNLVMSEILFQALLFGSYYKMVLFILDNKRRNLAWHILLLSLAILTKPVLYLIWIPEMLFFFAMAWKKKIKPADLLLGLIPALMVAMVSLVHLRKTGYFHYSSVRTTNLLSFNVHRTLCEVYSPEKADRELELLYQRANQQTSYTKKMQLLNAYGDSVLIRHFSSYVWIHFKGMIRFFTDHGRYGIDFFFTGNSPLPENGWQAQWKTKGWRAAFDYIRLMPLWLSVYLVLIMAVSLCTFYAFIRSLFMKKFPRTIRAYSAMVVLYIAFITGPVGDARYRTAVFPILVVTFALYANHPGRPFLIKKLFRSHFSE